MTLPAVRAAFVKLNDPIEGTTFWAYADRLGLVTTAMGDLCDPVSLMVTLPWALRGSTVPATRLQIIAEFNRVKALGVSHKGDGGGKGSIFERTAQLWLTPEGVSMIVDRKLDENDSYLTRSFPGFADWCADAQLALHAMAWALGAAFRPGYPHFSKLVDALNFQGAAGLPGDPTNPKFRGEAWIKDSVPDAALPYGERVIDNAYRKRNRAVKTLFSNAVVVIRDQKDPDTLYWPAALT